MAPKISAPLPEGMVPKAFSRRNKIESLAGSLYTFVYTSKTARIGRPLILNVRRNGRREFKAKNGGTYMAGIVLNNLPPGVMALLIRKLGGKKLITWREVKSLGAIAPKAYYRIYNTKYRRDFQVVDASIYLQSELA